MKIKPFVIAILFLLLLIGFFVLLYINNSSKKIVVNKPTVTPQIQKIAKVTINDSIIIQAEIADTPALMAKGLSGRTSLEKGKGMLFPFKTEGYHVFWMKDMLIPIDIVWISKGKIVHVEPDVPSPQKGMNDSTLPRYTPKQQADTVLEVPEGFIENNSITIGDQIQIEYQE